MSPRNALGGATLRAYQPTLRDKAANALLGVIGDGYERRKFVGNLLGSTGLGHSQNVLADYTGLTLPFQADEAGRKIAKGNVLGGMGDLALAAVPIPAAAKGAKAVGAALRKPVARANSALKPLDQIVQAAQAKGVKLSVQEGSNGLRLSQIVVPSQARNQGLGSQIMSDLTGYADSTGQRMTLTPSSDFGGSVPRLKKFYGSQGFVLNQGRGKDYSISDLMYRDPAKPVARAVEKGRRFEGGLNIGSHAEVQYMSPDEYISQAAVANGGSPGHQLGPRSTQRTEDLRKSISAEGLKEIPTLRYLASGRVLQDGMHRAAALKALGYDQIPVGIKREAAGK